VKDNFLTISQVAEELKVSKWTVRQYIHTGKLKASKPNGKNFIIMARELYKFVDNTEYKPIVTL
jgi:excisionase family DNA binding protein|tara:strand:- start:978 stop:1169 length:192 start_codon:yes stop_codon:yes gene_type:complete